MVVREGMDQAGMPASGGAEAGAGPAGGADEEGVGVEEIALRDLREEFEAVLGGGRVELEGSAEGPAAGSAADGVGDASDGPSSGAAGGGAVNEASSGAAGGGAVNDASSGAAGGGAVNDAASDGGRFASDRERHRAAIRAAKAHGLGIDDLEELERSENAEDVTRRAASMAEQRALRQKVEALERRLTPVQQFDSNRSSGVRGGNDEAWIDRYLEGDRSEDAVSAARRAFE